MTLLAPRSGRPAGDVPATGGVPDAAWARAVQLLSNRGTVVLICHEHPDGDALGSMLGLALALRRHGVPVRASFSGGPVPPPIYRDIPGRELLADPTELPAAPDLLVSLDCSSPARLGSLAVLVDAAREVLVLDHHARGQAFGSVQLIDPAAAATAVVAEELIGRLGVPLDADIAACLYIGLITDTGSFKYATTTPATHQLAARLLATGIRHEEIARRIWDTNPFGYLRVLAGALGRLALDQDAAGGLGLVWTSIPVAELLAERLTLPEVEGVIDVVRTTDSAEVAAVFKGDVDGTQRVSVRSKGRIDVGALCTGLGGGGHRFAAGYTTALRPPEAAAELAAALATADALPG